MKYLYLYMPTISIMLIIRVLYKMITLPLSIARFHTQYRINSLHTFISKPAIVIIKLSGGD